MGGRRVGKRLRDNGWYTDESVLRAVGSPTAGGPWFDRRRLWGGGRERRADLRISPQMLLPVMRCSPLSRIALTKLSNGPLSVPLVLNDRRDLLKRNRIARHGSEMVIPDPPRCLSDSLDTHCLMRAEHTFLFISTSSAEIICESRPHEQDVTLAYLCALMLGDVIQLLDGDGVVRKAVVCDSFSLSVGAIVQ